MSPYRTQSGLEATRLEVDLSAIDHNVAELRRLVGPDCLLYAALKCNAYGFGLVPSARRLIVAGVDAISVARAQDAIELREAGVAVPLLLYAGTVASPALVEAVERYDLTPTLVDLPSAEVFSRHATRTLPVFAKVDVGQRRLGSEPREFAAVVAALAELPRLTIDGLYTHLTAPPDPVPAGHLERQFDVFQHCVAEVEARGIDVRVRMAASSNVLRLSSEMSLNAVDPGRMYFGLVPQGTVGLDFRVALRSLRTHLIQVKELDDDPRRPEPPVPVRAGMTIGVIPLGTGDGLLSASAGEVLVHGRRAPLIEPISLEHCRIDLTDHPGAVAGDEVVVIGSQGGDEITIDEAAAYRGLSAGTYHVPISIRDSVPRTYLEE